MDIRKITLTNALGGSAMFCGGALLLLVFYAAIHGLFLAIAEKSSDLHMGLFLILPLCVIAIFLIVIGSMALIRGHSLIMVSSKENIILTSEIVSVFAGVVFYFVILNLFLSLVNAFSFSLFVSIAAGIYTHVSICRFVLRKEGFECSKGELVGKNLANVIAIIVFLASLGYIPSTRLLDKPDVYPGIGFLFIFLPVFIAYGVYRICCWGFKRI